MGKCHASSSVRCAPALGAAAPPYICCEIHFSSKSASWSHPLPQRFSVLPTCFRDQRQDGRGRAESGVGRACREHRTRPGPGATILLIKASPLDIRQNNFLQIDSLKKGFEGFDKEGTGTINQTTMQVILD